MTLTLLLGQVVTQTAADASGYADLSTAFVTLIRALDSFLQQHTTRPALPDPTCAAQNFHDRWSHADYARCRSAIHALVGLIEAAVSAQTDGTQVAGWQAIFGERFTVPADVMVAEAATRQSEQHPADLGITMGTPTPFSVRIDPVVRAGTGMGRFNLRHRKNRVQRGRGIDFHYSTTVLGHHQVFWKVKNTGSEAAAAGNYRGEIRERTAGEAHFESTLYRGQHSIQVFIVVNGVCWATQTQQVLIV